MKKKIPLFKLISTAFLVFILSACSSTGSTSKELERFEQDKYSSKSKSNDALNQKITTLGMTSQANSSDEYLLGAGDVIEITVFQVEELNTQVRVNGKGNIILPLVGTMNVDGKTVSDLEEGLRELLEKNYLQNPQIGVFISEYRSQQITVMGAVKEPNVYNVRKSRSIFEMISMAGGITEMASDKIRVRLNRKDDNGLVKQLNLVISLDDMIDANDNSHQIRLVGGDSILIPDAGVVFVEGAVEKPGSYKIEGEVTVLKAIALAGGIPWEAKSKAVQVFRKIEGEPVSVSVDIEAVKDQESEDVNLLDGDVVVVGYNDAKRAFSGFFKIFGSIFGYSLN